MIDAIHQWAIRRAGKESSRPAHLVTRELVREAQRAVEVAQRNRTGTVSRNPRRVERVEDVLKLGDEIEVKVIGIDKDGKVKLSRKVLL